LIAADYDGKMKYKVVAEKIPPFWEFSYAFDMS